MPVGAALGQIGGATGVTVGDAVVTLGARRVADLTCSAGRYGIPTGAACVTDLQCTAGTLMLIDVALRWVARSHRSRGYAERARGAAINILPLGHVVDDHTMLGVSLGARYIAPCGHGRTSSKTTCRRS